MLIHRSIIEKIGYPDKKLFFFGDDTIYGYLASNYTNVLYIRDICLIKKIDKRNEKISRLSAYLRSRNILVYISSFISKEKKFWLLFSIYHLLRTLIHFLLKFDFIRFYDSFLGYIHGLKGKWGGEKKYLKN